mgnify:CR=1 FL=1
MTRPLLFRALPVLIAAVFAAPVLAQAPAPASKAPATKAAPKKAATKPFTPVLEPRAVELLQAMSQRLGAAKSLSFTAVASYEYPSRLGPPRRNQMWATGTASLMWPLRSRRTLVCVTSTPHLSQTIPL